MAAWACWRLLPAPHGLLGGGAGGGPAGPGELTPPTTAASGRSPESRSSVPPQTVNLHLRRLNLSFGDVQTQCGEAWGPGASQCAANICLPPASQRRAASTVSLDEDWVASGSLCPVPTGRAQTPWPCFGVRILAVGFRGGQRYPQNTTQRQNCKNAPSCGPSNPPSRHQHQENRHDFAH